MLQFECLAILPFKSHIKETGKANRPFDYFALQLNFAGLGGDYQAFGNDGEAVRLASASISAVGLYPLGDSGFSLLGSVGAGGINLAEVTRFDGAYTFEGQTSKLVTAEVGVRYVHPSHKNWRYDLSYEGRFFDEQNYQTDTDNIRFKQLDTLWLGVSYAF
ncbi:hypothetical protein [Paraferrimonas sp. SM1919]|uniref:hypothetical protein n=1 Tax=Paraferrimonas sp. SM1919 TaxID=2662263 RepID=UPI0013D363E9|nr:hypothetical protein [Paraferrimonas sp. SM1919]